MKITNAAKSTRLEKTLLQIDSCSSFRYYKILTPLDVKIRYKQVIINCFINLVNYYFLFYYIA